MEENNQNQPPVEEAPTPAEQPIGTPPPFIERPKPKTKLLIIISAIIIGLLILLAGGFFALNTYIRNEELKPNESITKSKIPSPTPNPTANWKTYENEVYGFSIKYPLRITYNVDRNFPPDLFFTSDHNVVFSSNNNLPDYALLISSLNQKQYLDIMQKLDSIANQKCSGCPIKSSIIIDGKKAEIYDHYGGELLYKIYLTHNEDKYFSITRFSGESSPHYLYELSDQILSTFKFTDQNSTSACIPEPSICKNQLAGAYPKECVEPTEGWCP